MDKNCIIRKVLELQGGIACKCLPCYLARGTTSMPQNPTARIANKIVLLRLHFGDVFVLRDHFQMSSLRVREYLGRMVEVEMELMTLGAFLGMVRYGVVNRFETDDMICVCGTDGVLICVSQEMVRHLFAIGIFRLLLRMHCNPIYALLAIVCSAEVDWNVTGIEWF